MSEGLKEQLGGRLPANLDISQGTPLFSFDLNFDSLKVFLDKTSATINQHAELINALQAELQSRPTHKVLPEQLSVISDGGKIMDSNLEKIIKGQTTKSLKNENTGDNLSNQSNKVYNRLTTLGYAAAYNYSQITGIPARFEGIEKEMNKKAIKEEVKEKHKKLKSKLITEVEEIKKYFEKKILDLDQKYNDKISTFEDKLQGVEKKTLWKIQDCEEMLKKRITEEYVDDSCKALEDKIKREVTNSASSDADKIERISAELLGKMKFLEDQQSEKNKSTKKFIKDLEDLVNNSCAKQSFFDEFKKTVTGHIDALNRRQKELESSLQIQSVLERQNVRMKSTDDRLNDLSENFSARIQELSILVNQNRGKTSTGDFSGTSNVDPHKLCQLEGDLIRAKEDLKKQQAEIDKIKESVISKLDNIDLNVYEAGMNKGNSGGSGSGLSGVMEIIDQMRKQVNDLISAKDSSQGEELKKALAEMKELAKKMESIKDLERRMQRIFKEYDFNGMQRQIKQKAESDDVLKDFAIVDTKINTNQEQIGFCRKDIDNLILLYKKLLQALQQGGGANGDINSIITTKKLTPFNQLNCLSCGVTKTNQAGKGIDGKMYKADTSMVNDATQVYDQPRGIFHGSSLSQSSQQFSRPRTAQARNETQQSQPNLAISNYNQTIQRTPAQVPTGNGKRSLRPESAKK